MIQRLWRWCRIPGTSNCMHKSTCKLSSIALSLTQTDVWNMVRRTSPSPLAASRPEHVRKFLAQYMIGVPISDRRLVRQKHGRVTLSSLAGTTDRGDETKDVPRSDVEFVRCWFLQIRLQDHVDAGSVAVAKPACQISHAKLGSLTTDLFVRVPAAALNAIRYQNDNACHDLGRPSRLHGGRFWLAYISGFTLSLANLNRPSTNGI